jgi:hypothetical protein
VVSKAGQPSSATAAAWGIPPIRIHCRTGACREISAEPCP